MNRHLRAPSPDGFADRIRALAQAFTEGVLAAAKRAPLHDLVELGEPSRAVPSVSHPRAPRRPSARGAVTHRRAPRSLEKIASLIEGIVEAVEATPHGLSAGELREHLQLDRSAFARPIQEAVATGRIAVQGERRATVYIAAPAKEQKGAKRAGKGTGARPRSAPKSTPSVASKRSAPHAERPSASEDEGTVTADAPSEDAEARGASA